VVGRDLALVFPAYRQWQIFGYVNDKWQIRPRLTLNLGLRWEFYRPGTSHFPGGFSNYDPTNNNLVVAGVGGNPLDIGMQRNYKDFAPRIGVAYQFTSKDVVRAGYGISYEPFADNTYAYDFPVKQNNAFNNVSGFGPAILPNGTPATFANGFPAPLVATIPSNGIIPANTPLLISQSYDVINLHYRDPYIQSWNLTYERALPAKFTLDVSYVGNRGVRAPIQYDLNAISNPAMFGAGAAGQPLHGFCVPGTARAQEEAVVEQLAPVLAAEDAREWQPELFTRALVAPATVVRRIAAMAAGRIGDLRATPRLIQLLDEPDSTVRVAAAFALGLLRDSAAVDALIERLTGLPPLDTASADEAITALRFALGVKPSAKPLRALLRLLEEPDALVARAARDTLTVVPGVATADLARLARAKSAELALWTIERLRTVGAARELAALAGGADRARAEAAVRALAGLPEAGPILVAALASVEEEAGAHALAEALERVELSAREVSKLRAAGAASLKKSFAIARRQLEPVRRADPQGWAELLREAAKKTSDPARAEAISELLARSSWASLQDRFAYASLLLRRSQLDPHPRARQADPALLELEKLAADGFAVADALAKDRAATEEARYHAGFHFAEHPSAEGRAQGIALLEELAGRGRSKIARAAKNKLGLLRG